MIKYSCISIESNITFGRAPDKVEKIYQKYKNESSALVDLKF